MVDPDPKLRLLGCPNFAGVAEENAPNPPDDDGNEEVELLDPKADVCPKPPPEPNPKDEGWPNAG